MSIYRQPPQPQQGNRLVPPSIAAVPEDNPPFGLRTPLGPIIEAWQPGPGLPWHGYWIVQEGEVAEALKTKRLLTLLKVGM